MFVCKSMTEDVITVGPEADIFNVHELMKENNIRHIPVVDEERKLLGIVTDRDLRSAMPSSLAKDECSPSDMSEFKIKNIMTPLSQVATISPLDTIQDALLLIEKRRVGAIPVVDENKKVVGIISVRDLLRAFVNVLGIEDPGTLLGVLVPERMGELKKIVDAITEMKVSFGSVLVVRHWEEDKRAVFPYLLTNNVVPVKKKLKSLGYEILNPMEWYIDKIKADRCER